MKQHGQWAKYAEAILATGRRPHFAPAQEILELHERQLCRACDSKGEPLTVLVLGATPELADLALRYACRVLRVDCNPAMFEAAAQCRSIQNGSRELRIVADWLDLPMIRDESIDFVFGDFSLNNVAHPSMARMLQEIRRITHETSILSLTQLVIPDSPVEAYGFSRVVSSYRKGEINTTEFHKTLRFYSFNEAAYDAGQHILDAKKVFEAIDEKHRARQLSDAEYELLQPTRSEIQHTVYRQSEQIELLRKLGACTVEPFERACFYEHLIRVFVVQRR